MATVKRATRTGEVRAWMKLGNATGLRASSAAGNDARASTRPAPRRRWSVEHAAFGDQLPEEPRRCRRRAPAARLSRGAALREAREQQIRDVRARDRRQRRPTAAISVKQRRAQGNPNSSTSSGLTSTPRFLVRIQDVPARAVSTRHRARGCAAGRWSRPARSFARHDGKAARPALGHHRRRRVGRERQARLRGGVGEPLETRAA